MDTGGALLLTDDGDLAYRLTHPKYGVDKSYRVGLERQPSTAAMSKLKGGILFEGKKTSPANVSVVGAGREGTEIQIVIHEGRNRQVRKMCEAVGYPAIWLERNAFAGITVDDLARGAWRHLREDEIAKLKASVQMEGTS